MKKNELYDLAKSMYTEQFITEAEIARRLNISDRTVRRWKANGKWGQRRINGLDKETFSNEDIKTIARKMLKELHSQILKLSRGSISINVPNNDFKKQVQNTFSDLETVMPFIYKPEEVYKQNDETKVLTKEKNVSQADIMETFKFPIENTVKEKAVGRIMNTLLSNSASIGLFNTLREKEQLAYSVYSDIYSVGDSGEVALNILTTTDNKDIGEISYDNLQKSINGFNRQIKELLNSKYTDEDLGNAKRLLKANLLENEGTYAKLKSLDNGINSNYGIEYKNQIYNEIDSITREDVDQFAQKVFANSPIYSIVASKDTLEQNRQFLECLKNS